MPFNWNADYHIVRIVVTGKTTTVYLDEETTPFITGESNDQRDNFYFEWGKSGGADYGAYVDWMALNITEASAPDTGTALPAGLLPAGVSTNAPLLQNQVRVYPNPASETITVQLPQSGDYKARIVSLAGRVVTGEIAVRQLTTMDVSSLQKGLYVLVVSSASGQIARTKLLID